jgi:iron-sulfur cluster assembly accessory protein
MTTSDTTLSGLTISDSALAKIREVMTQQQLEADERNLRVFVEGGGCCGGGPSFGLAFDKATPEDAKFELGGMTVVVDPMSLPFCAGATIDYLDTPEVQGFKVNAPAMQQTQGGCGSGGGGCGSGGGGGGGGGGCCSGEAEQAASAKHSHGGGHGGCGCG